MAETILTASAVDLTNQELIVEENYNGTDGIITRQKKLISDLEIELANKLQKKAQYDNGTIITVDKGAYQFPSKWYNGSYDIDGWGAYRWYVLEESIPNFGNLNKNTAQQAIKNIQDIISKMEGKLNEHLNGNFVYHRFPATPWSKSSKEIDFTDWVTGNFREIPRTIYRNSIDQWKKCIEQIKAANSAALANYDILKARINELQNILIPEAKAKLEQYILDYKQALDDAREEAINQAESSVKFTLAGDAEYQKALAILEADEKQAALDAQIALEKEKIAANTELEKAKISATNEQMAAIAAAEKDANDITKKVWFWPVVIGAGVVIVGGLIWYFVRKKQAA